MNVRKGACSMNAKVVAIIVLLIVLLIFAIQNTQPVVLTFLFWHLATSSVLSILVSYMIGLLTGCLLMMIWRRKRG
jgi:lipopolysaccharide assembly protein A